LTGDQAAQFLGISPSTADRHGVYARAWLRREVQGRGGGDPPGWPAPSCRTCAYNHSLPAFPGWQGVRSLIQAQVRQESGGSASHRR
jgi:hypothetical protein